MKKKKIAFTLVELLITVSIVAIISVSSINGFFNFLQEKEANMKIMEFSFYIDSLDKKVKNHDFFDYQIEINTNNSPDSYIVYTDYFDVDYFQNIIYDYTSDSAQLNLSGATSQDYSLKIYKEGKLNYNSSSASYNYSKSLDKDYDYKFISTLSGATEVTILNDIILNRFDKSENEMILIKVVDTEGSTTDIGDLTIRNIGGKKDFFDSNNNYYDEIYLYFENKGSESFIKLTK